MSESEGNRELLKVLVARYNASKPAARVHFEFTSESKVFIYLSVRTTSFDFAGERTDLHDALSVLAGCLLRFSGAGVSCSLWDERNPAGGLETEIYARLLTVEQPNGSVFDLDADGLDQINSLISCLYTLNKYLSALFGVSQGTLEDNNHSYTEAIPWAREVSGAIDEPLPVLPEILDGELRYPYEGEPFGDYAQFNLRRNPAWLYYRSLRHNLSIYRSPAMVQVLRLLVNRSDQDKFTSLQGINADFLMSDKANNAIPHSDIQFSKDLLSDIDDNSIKPTYLPLENFLVVAGENTVLFAGRECGRKRFQEERELIRARHNMEAKLLFPPENKQFSWITNVNGRRFELLILDLLKREPGVRFVRQASDSYEPDQGRDLIAEWDSTILGEVIYKGENPLRTSRVVVQCKASKSSVGKAQVQDIRDTIEHHDSNGYFLAVSSQITTSVTKHLEHMRTRGQYFIDWWARPEVEEKLRANLDIAERYRDLFSF